MPRIPGSSTSIVTAASSEQVGLLELFQIQNQQGPCLDCYTGGVTVTHAALDQGSPWPLFAAESVKAGFPSVFAVPLRLKSSTIGCLNLFMSESVVLSRSDIVLAQALADVATIVIIQDQAAREAAQRVGSLQNALTSRIAIEQAKGMIAERFSVDMNTAFGRLRTYARRTNQRLSDVAAAVASGDLTISAVNGATRLPPPPTRTQPVAEPARSDRQTT